MPLSNLVSSLDIMDKAQAAAHKKDQSCGNVDRNLCYPNWLPQTPGFLKGLCRTCTLDPLHPSQNPIPEDSSNRF